MKKILIIICALLCLQLQAQTVVQKGYVRTIGRPDNKSGTRLANVAIYVSGNHNATLSNAKGEFSLAFNDASVGKDGYKISRVRLSGYEVQEKEMLGRLSPISSTIPREIVLVSLAEKRKIEDRIREQIEHRYEEKLRQLEADKEKIGEEKYHEGMARMEEVYNQRDQLIMDMVERYAHTDYALLNETEAQINAFIERGELERADSVINSMNLAALEQEHHQLTQDIATKKQEIQQEEQAQKNIVEQLMLGYRSRFELCQAKFQKDSALYYLEKIVDLDTTNWENIRRTGSFVYEYFSQYDSAKSYYERALRILLSQYDENHPTVADLYCDIGDTYLNQSYYTKAKEYYTKALTLKIKHYGEDAPEVSSSYNRIGDLHEYQGGYIKAQEYYEKALAINRQAYGDSSLNVSDSYCKLGDLFCDLLEHVKAKEYYEKAKDIQLQHFSEDSPETSRLYYRMGILYKDIDDYDVAEDYYKKALKIDTKVYGKDSRKVAMIYNNLGTLYLAQEYTKAKDYFEKALIIDSELYGADHPCVASSYSDLGSFYQKQKNYVKAKEYYDKALNIQINAYGENHIDVSTTYSQLGDLYFEQGDEAKAKEYIEKSLTIAKNLYGENSTTVLEVYLDLGFLYFNKEDIHEAIKYFEKAELVSKNYGQLSNFVGIVNLGLGLIYSLEATIGGDYINEEALEKSKIYLEKGVNEVAEMLLSDSYQLYQLLGFAYMYSNEYQKSIDYYNKALDICKQMYGEYHINTAEAYYEIGASLVSNGEHFAAIDFLKQSLNIYQRIDCNDESEIATTYKGIVAIYISLEEYQIAGEFLNNALDFYKNRYGENHAITQEFQQLVDIYNKKFKDKINN